MGDYTRVTDRPEKRYTAVLMQQGRVQLDADWNEKVAIGRRRWETQALDTFGRCAVPKTTPAAFQVGVPSGTPLDFTLGTGRIYVDGLLAEIFAGETHKGNPITYRNQPFYPSPPALPSTGIVVLDVWDREVTAIEDPDLLERALGGPDTTARLQTVWQVKGRPSATGVPAACGADLGSGISGGRLSTRTAVPPPDPDPCILPPTSGYRGLENQLYRVEVHTGGPLGTARFKWSRDNASLVAAVEEIVTSGSQSTLTVSRVGYDSVRRFQMGDWVEILDDHRELREEGGVMARVVAPPDDAARKVTLDRAIPAGTFDAADVSRHTRLRKWDEQAGVDGDGLLTTTPAWVPLENGIEVQLSVVPSGEFRPGDFWVLWARYVDGSIETLTNAPPRGIIHHYGQLAAINAGVVQDCRPLWPAECGGCCCTVTVGAGSEAGGDYADLASALAALPAVAPDAAMPVRICLLPGDHSLAGPVTIARDRVTVVGCGALARLVPAATAFHITGNDVALEALFIDANVSPPMIEILGERCRLEGNRLRNTGGFAVVATGATELAVLGNIIEGGLGISVHGEWMRIWRNQFDHGALRLRAGCDRVDVEDNDLIDAHGYAAIVLGTRLPDERALVLSGITLQNNRIRSASGNGIASEAALPGMDDALRTQILGLTIAENEIDACVARAAGWAPDSPPFGGIVLNSVHHLVLAHNRIEDNGPEASVPICGVYVARSRGFEAHGNQVVNNGPRSIDTPAHGPQGGIVLLDASVPVGAASADDALATPDGSPAALVVGNTIVAPRGLALHLRGMGPMLVKANRLTAYGLVGGGHGDRPKLEDLVGAVLIVNHGMPAYYYAALSAMGYTALRGNVSLHATATGDQWVVGGKVQFSNNQVTLDLRRERDATVFATVALISMDDVQASGNQTECIVASGLIYFDLAVFGVTTRQIGNGLTETPNRCAFSMLSMGGAMNAGADNQGTHCIRVNGPAGRTVNRDNLVLLPSHLCAQ